MLGILKWLWTYVLGPRIAQLKWAVSSWATLAKSYLRDITDLPEELTTTLQPATSDRKSITGLNMESVMLFLTLLVTVPLLQVVLFMLLLLHLSLLVVPIVLELLFSPVLYALYRNRCNTIAKHNNVGQSQQIES